MLLLKLLLKYISFFNGLSIDFRKMPSGMIGKLMSCKNATQWKMFIGGFVGMYPNCEVHTTP